MLLDGDCEILGFGEQSGMDFVVRDPEAKLASVVGWPPREAIAQAASHSTEVLAQFDNQGPIVAALSGWKKECATLHVLGDTPRLPSAPDGAVRLLTRKNVASLTGLPSDLKSELQTAIRWSALAATIVDGRPVSFCYAGSETESLWDISIDTLEGYRRRGFASLCVANMISHMRALGKEPVWAALESNAESLGLAAKLGFEPVDRIVVIYPPAGE
jgi:GNAT superfamily N-acetyltransferase